jgi:hypothetical protein
MVFESILFETTHHHLLSLPLEEVGEGNRSISLPSQGRKVSAIYGGKGGPVFAPHYTLQVVAKPEYTYLKR